MSKKKFISTKMKITMASLLIGSISFLTAAGVLLYNSDYKLSKYFSFDNFSFPNFSANIRTQFNFENLLSTTSLALDNIDNLNLQFDKNIVNIETYDGDRLELSIYGGSNSLDLNGAPPFLVNEDNKTLSVKLDTESFSSINPNTYSLNIKIPSSYSKGLKLSSLAGKVELNSMNLSSLNIVSNNTTISLNGVSFHSGNLDVKNGDLSIVALKSTDLNLNVISTNLFASGLSGNINITSIYSNIQATLTNNTTGLTASVNSGSIDLYFPVDGNFTISPSVINGNYHNEVLNNDFDTSNDHYYNVPSPVVLGSGENKINLDVVNGNIGIFD